MIDKSNIDFIDGYLTSVSHLCYGMNFVPVYGAKKVDVLDLDVQESIKNQFESESAIANFRNCPNSAKNRILELLNKWVRGRIFEGEAQRKNISTRFSIYQMQSYLLEFIEDIVSNHYKLFEFSVEHDDFGYETEALCFYGNDKCIYIYFGWWD